MHLRSAAAYGFLILSPELVVKSCPLGPVVTWDLLRLFLLKPPRSCSLRYFSTKKLDVDLHSGHVFLHSFTFQTPTSSYRSFIILALASSETIMFFPFVVAAWLVCTNIFFSSKLIMTTGNGFASSCICWSSPNVKRPSFWTDWICRWK
jgi:hypothetical protein